MNFDNLAKNWDTDRRIKRAELISNEIQKAVCIDKNQRALEFGAGTGLISFNLHNSLKSVDLLDSSKRMIEVVEDKITTNKISNMKTIHIDIETKHKLSSKYNVIYSSMVLHHIKNVKSIISQFSEVLQDHGELCIIDLNEVDEAFHKEESDFEGHHGFNLSELEKLLMDNGFCNIKTNTFYHSIKKVESIEIPYSLFIMSAKK